MLRLAAAALVLLSAWTAADAWAEGERRLGRLEQESVDEALARHGLRLEPAPQGKTIGEIHIVNQEVFSQRDWWFQWFNIFHRTTREETLRRELLMRPGQPYDEALIDETIRNLQSPPAPVVAGRTLGVPELSSVVVILPIASARPGTVDLLVVTRDVWSLRFNTNFEFQQNILSLLETSLSENNLFGWRKYLAANFVMDQGTMGFGPTYYDPNIRGTRLTLYANALLIYRRDTQAHEGDRETFSLRYPLFSLATRWGGGVDVVHQDAVIRNFHANNLRLEDVVLPDGTTVQVPFIYRRKIVTVDSSLTRSFGAAVIQRVTAGHLFDARRSETLPEFVMPPAAQAFLEQIAAASERRSEPYLRYDVFTARYGIFRDLDTFDLRENHQLGPSLSLRVGYGLPALGADFAALVLSGSAAWAVAPRGGYGRVLVEAGARRRREDLIDQSVHGLIYGASPLLGRALRLVLSGDAGAVRADTYHTLYFLGGSTGLRGYAIGDFQGTSYFVSHAEVRSRALAVWSQRLGGVLFYDVGHAAPSFATLVPHHDLGVGLRWLIPQLNSAVLRVDWAFATQSTTFTRAGFPGRFTAGYQQVF